LINRFNETLFFAREQHACQQTGSKKLKKKNKNLQFKSGSIFMEKIPTDAAGAMKVSRKITTQHGLLIFHEFLTKDNTEPK